MEIEGEDAGLIQMSPPAICGNDVRLVGIIAKDNDHIKQLIHIHLPDGKVTRLGHLAQPWSALPEDAGWGA